MGSMTMTPDQRAALVKPVRPYLDGVERVAFVTKGALHGPRQDKGRAQPSTVVVTDRRLVFFRPKPGGDDFRSLDLDRVVAVDHGLGRFVGELRLTTSTGATTRVSSMAKDDVVRLARLLRRRLAH